MILALTVADVVVIAPGAAVIGLTVGLVIGSRYFRNGHDGREKKRS